MAGSDKRARQREGLPFGNKVRPLEGVKRRSLSPGRVIRGSDRPVSGKTSSPPPRFCHSCGARKRSDRSFCPSCGMRSPERRGDPTLRPSTDARGGVADRRGRVIPPARSSGKSGRVGTSERLPSWIVGRGLRNVAASFFLIGSFLVGLQTLTPVASETVTPVTTVPSTPTASTVDLATLRLYSDQISALGSDVAAVAANGRRINEEWEQGNVDYQPTRDQMRALVTRTAALSARLAEIEVPPMADPLAHRQMLLEMSTFVSAAGGMSAGFESTDSGEARLAALSRFVSAAREFGALASEAARVVRSATT